jgi:hypothetical protein
MVPRMSVKRLCREWIALLAILAMALGPLALATSRGLSARERVNVAAGLATLPLCQPGDGLDSMAGKLGAPCDHCLATLCAGASAAPGFATPFIFSERLGPADTGRAALPADCSLPPATGPPAA